jgi:small multidrug resistance pump/quaternary ammonium compound-resistance protein SugE
MIGVLDMSLLIAIMAAFAFTVGGVFMKYSQGLSVLLPTIATYGLFLIGTTLQTFLMHGADLGITYLLVLGLEAILASLFGICIFHEKLSPTNLSGIFLVVVGVACLRANIK